MYGHDPARSFAQSRRCTEINRRRVSTLLPSWFVPTADSVTASPAVVDGVAYVGSWDGVMHALDERTGAERWHFAINDTSKTAFGRIESSAAVVKVGTTSLVVFGGGSTLYALDAATGAPLASVCVDPRSNPAVRCQGASNGAIEILSSPAIVRVGNEIRVVVGMDVHNASNVGRTGLLGFRLAASPWRLEPLWKFDPETRATYTGPGLLTQDAGHGDGCASVWSSPAVDVPNDMLFFGTGSCGDPTITSGESVWGIKLSTGAFVWSYDAHAPGRYPSRLWDDDFGASPNLLPNGMVGVGSKDGWYYALKRVTGQPDGELVWKTHAGESGHVTQGFAVGGMIGSAAIGMARGEPAIFATTAISTPLRAPLDETPGDIDPGLLEDPGRLFSMHAMSAKTGKILWRSPWVRASYGAPTYANGVVMVPSTFDFTIKALDADTGMVLWLSPVVGAPSAAPVMVGPSLIVGAGTRTTDVEYKTFGASALEALIGPSPLTPLSGVWGFRLALR
jgi:outer membrane protein assembly factor BamB